MTVRSVGPLGLAARQRRSQVPGVLRSLPPFASRRHLPRAAGPAPRARRPGRGAVRGQGTEFDSLREYVERRRRPLHRLARHRPAPAPSSCAPGSPSSTAASSSSLDTSRTSAGRVGDVPRLDAAMDAALLLAALAEPRRRPRRRPGRRPGGPRPGRRLGRPAATCSPTRLRAGAGRRQRSSRPTGRPWPRGLTAAATTGRSSCCSPRSSRPPSRRACCPVLPALVRRPPRRRRVASRTRPSTALRTRARHGRRGATTRPRPSARPARVAGVAAALERLGVDVIDADADALPPRLADHYLTLKRAGLL